MADVYGVAFGSPNATHITIEGTNGFRIRHGTTNKLVADTAGNLTLAGSLAVAGSGTFVASSVLLDTAGITLTIASGGAAVDLNAYRFSTSLGSGTQQIGVYGYESAGANLRSLHLNNSDFGGADTMQTNITAKSGSENCLLQLTATPSSTSALLAADEITLGGNLVGPEKWAPAAVVIPAQITSDQHNYSPSGLSTARVLRLSSDASRTITGIDSPSSGNQFLILTNGGTQDIVLAHASGSSSAGNQFVCPGGGNLTLHLGDSVEIYYDQTQGFWIVIEH